MGKVMINLVSDHFYNIDFSKIKDSLYPLLIEDFSNGYVVRDKDFLLIIGPRGGLKIGIEFDSVEELTDKLSTVFKRLDKLNSYYKEFYAEELFNKLFFSWNSNFTFNSNDIWIAGEHYRGRKLSSDYGLELSELTLV